MAKASEVWMIDLGMVAKVRPCRLLTNYPADDELALVAVLPAHHGAARQPLGIVASQTFPQAGRVSSSADSIRFHRQT